MKLLSKMFWSSPPPLWGWRLETWIFVQTWTFCVISCQKSFWKLMPPTPHPNTRDGVSWVLCEFWTFHAIPISKSFFILIFTPPSLGAMFIEMILCTVLDIYAIPSKLFLVHWPPHHPYGVGVDKHGFSVQCWTFDTIPCKNILVEWSLFLSFKEWGGINEVLCADLDISCTFHQNTF